jgi:hypothetical protein
LPIARTEGTPLSRAQGISIGRPQPLDPGADPDGSGVVPTAFRPAAAPEARLVPRGKLLDDPPGLTIEPTDRKAAAAVLPAAPIPVDQGPARSSEKLTKLPAPGPAQGSGGATLLPPLSEPVAPLAGSTVFGTDPCGPYPTVPDSALFEGGAPGGQAGFTGGPAQATGGRFYASAEYLLWFIKGYNTPPLVTTSPASVPQPMQGVLGFPSTAVLFGGSQLTQDPFSGGRFFAGYRFGPCNLWAAEVGGFFLGSQTTRFAAASPFPAVIARPFIGNSPTGMAETAELTASPGSNPGELFSSAGSLRIAAPTQFWGLEANLRRQVCCGCNYNLDLLAGYRYLNLSEGLHITEDLVALRAVPAAGTGVGDHIIVIDNFTTRNQFNGGQLGAVGEYRFGKLILGGSLKVALGDMHEQVSINGATSITSATPGVAPRTFNSGLLALSSNSGTFTRDRFAVVPEVGLRVGYQVTNSLRVFVAYNFLYVSDVVRPGDQIDRVLNTNLIPPFSPSAPAGPVHPVVPFKSTDLWVQGVSFGLEWRY